MSRPSSNPHAHLFTRKKRTYTKKDFKDAPLQHKLCCTVCGDIAVKHIDQQWLCGNCKPQAGDSFE